MIKALIFDVDDTLYDPAQPFKRALEQHLSLEGIDLSALYVAFRHYSDQVFEDSVSGRMSMEAMHAYRMTHALADFGLIVTEDEALAIQKDYQTYQGQLELRPEMDALLTHCQQEGLTLGVITNGPHQHQLMKIQALDLTKWMKEEYILISGQLGITKPSLGIFQEMQTRLGLEAEQICYIGDSFDNDIIGAKEAGWQAIWFNPRERQRPQTSIQPDLEITKASQLLAEWVKWLDR